jgi:iron complex transport system substrate-binding protein
MKRIAGTILSIQLLMAGQAVAAPQRIMSLKVCTDELLLDLVPASRIASVSFLSREKAALRVWPQAAHIAVNHNSAEEILAAHPDLILTDSFAAPSLRLLLAKSGARVVEVPPAENFAQIRAVTRQVAAAVGEKARGEALIARMDAQLRELAARRPKKPLVVAGWGGGGYVPGKGGLFDAMLKAAGAVNMEAGAFGYYDVESLLAAHPDVLAYGGDYAGTASLRDDQNLHPALLARYAHRRVMVPSLFGCGTVHGAEVALKLQAALIAAARR